MDQLSINGNGSIPKAKLGKGAAAMDAVVKVFCTHTEPNYSLPWQRIKQYSSFSSGFVIDGRRVLTTAHSVDHHVQVKLKKRGSDKKYLAIVLAIGRECDIALLTVEDDEFWEGISPVQFVDLPEIQAAVAVVGYPVGGDTISITTGVVSRVEILTYIHGLTKLLGLQIDAAINSGNSGGPTFNTDGKCVGIAFQFLKDGGAQNIGHVIPALIVKHFLQDYEMNGAYTGFPTLGVKWQIMENPDLRMSMGMKSDQKGVLIRKVNPRSPEAQVLRPSDIILSLDGIDISNDGTEIFEYDVTIKIHERLVPAHNKGEPPLYYIVAGLVFTTLSVPYSRSEYGDNYKSVPVKLIEKGRHGMPQYQDDQLVIVSQVLAGDITTGYEGLENIQVIAFNSKPVENLKSLVIMVENCTDEFLKFDLEYKFSVVLRNEAAKAATQDILKTHSIPSAMSEKLKSCDI